MPGHVLSGQAAALLVDLGFGPHHYAWDAKAALEPAARSERSGVAPPLTLVDALEGGDHTPLGLGQRDLAGHLGLVVEHHRAAAALPGGRAAVFGRGDVEFFTEGGQQVGVVGADAHLAAVEGEGDLGGTGGTVGTDGTLGAFGVFGTAGRECAGRHGGCGQLGQLGPARGGAGVGPRWEVIRVVHFRPPVPLEIENGRRVPLAPVEVAGGHDDLVAGRERLSNHLPGRGDDAALGDGVDAFFDPTLGRRHHPGPVLIGAGLHDELVVEGPQDVLRGVGGVMDGGVVAAADQFDTL